MNVSVEVIIRFHSILELPRFDKCIFSLSYAKQFLRLNVVLQNFSSVDEKKVHDALRAHDFCEFIVSNVPNPENKDLRAHLLNIGLNAAICPLIHFVDYDDIIFSSAYERIIGVACSDRFKSAIYFFRVARAYSNVINGFDLVTCVDQPWRGANVGDLIVDNFCPLHSYLFNLNFIRQSGMVFDESYSALEDYDFLLRVVSKFSVSFDGIDIVIGLYNFRNDDSNSTIIGANQDEARALKWNRGRDKILELKKNLALVLPAG